MNETNNMSTIYAKSWHWFVLVLTGTYLYILVKAYLYRIHT